MTEDAINATEVGEVIDFGEKPESLAGYATHQLLRLERLGPIWEKYQPLFSFLTIAYGPVHIDEISGIIGKEILFETIPYQISRWIYLNDTANYNSSRRPSPRQMVVNKYPVVGFIHPRIKESFKFSLGYKVKISARNYLNNTLSSDYCDWSEYSIKWIPSHLLEEGLYDKFYECLNDRKFISARRRIMGDLLAGLQTRKDRLKAKLSKL